jgi:hypothetical protein
MRKDEFPVNFSYPVTLAEPNSRIVTFILWRKLTILYPVSFLRKVHDTDVFRVQRKS